MKSDSTARAIGYDGGERRFSRGEATPTGRSERMRKRGAIGRYQDNNAVASDYWVLLVVRQSLVGNC